MTNKFTVKGVNGEFVEEGGITENSLHNAEVLIKSLGIPNRVILTYVEDPWDYICTAVYGNKSFMFSGFSWGYLGEGPRGLAKFLASIDSSRDESEWIKTIVNLSKEQEGLTIFERKQS